MKSFITAYILSQAGRLSTHIFPVLLSLGLAFCLIGCGAAGSPDSTETEQNTTAEKQESAGITETAGTAETAGITETAGTSAGGGSEEESMLEENQIRITVGEHSFVVLLEENESAAALLALLEAGDKTIPASNYGGFEKVCPLGTTLPSNDVQLSTSAGDVMLYSSNQIVIFYASNSWAYTRLGKVEGLSAKELEEILSGPETEITLSLK